MTLLSVVRDVCAVVGVQMPTSVFANIDTNRTMAEMLSLANEMAQTIAYDGRDWTLLRKIGAVAGDDVTTGFSLPADYQRFLLTSNVWRSSSTQTPMQFISDTDQWANRRMSGNTNWMSIGSWGEWTILGGLLHIFPPLTVTEKAYFAYLNKNCIDLKGGGHGDVFMDDADSFSLDERVLKLGMIWRWKAQKGSAYTEDLGTYGDALANVSARDSPAPILLPRTVNIGIWGKRYGSF
jgi:hypothetical protein